MNVSSPGSRGCFGEVLFAAPCPRGRRSWSQGRTSSRAAIGSSGRLAEVSPPIHHRKRSTGFGSEPSAYGTRSSSPSRSTASRRGGSSSAWRPCRIFLGEHQDAQVAMQRLGSLVDELGPDLEPKVVFAMGRVAERYAVRADELRRGFDDEFAPVRRRWRRLHRRMEARRDELGWRRPQPVSRGSARIAGVASEVDQEARSVISRSRG